MVRIAFPVMPGLPAGAALAASALVLAGCATVPSGPSLSALPGSQRTAEQFRYDDVNCRGYALSQSGGRSASQSANASTATGAVAGTAIGALAGAAIGGSQGAGVGAGTGLLMGTAVGASNAPYSAAMTQRLYDHAYLQCMYASGHKVPVVGVPQSYGPVQAGTPVNGDPVIHRSGLPSGQAPMPPAGQPSAVPRSAPGAVPTPPTGAPPAPPRTWRGG